jgi:hypothetical protein
MQTHYDKIVSLVEVVKINSSYISYYFYCPITKKRVISTLPFEPYSGKITFSYKEILLHPIKSYHKYYHTPIVVYDANTEETILLKAFAKVQHQFEWHNEKQSFICM